MKRIIYCYLILDFFVFTCLLTCPLISNCQNVSIIFSYDNSGNRIRREISITDAIEVKSTDSILKQFTQKLSLQENDELLAWEISVFPNPTDGKLTIVYKGAVSGECTDVWFYSITGQEMFTDRFCMGETSYDLREIPPGTYILILRSGDRNGQWKIIKKE